MTDIYALLREQALKKSQHFPDEHFLIRGLWKTDLIFKPNVHERTFKYTYVLAQTMGQGCCYCPPSVVLDPSLLGRDAREIIREKNPVSIAVLDSLFSAIPRQPQEVHELCCNSVEKTALRNSIILHEAERLLSGLGNKRACIINVGLVGDLVRRLGGRDEGQGTRDEFPTPAPRPPPLVRATDFDEAVVGKSLHGVVVEHGSKTPGLVSECDLAIVTGMTISNDSLEVILETARAHGAKVLMFAETGANFAEEYCTTLGIDCVVSEPFPFYIFQGTTRIEVYRKPNEPPPERK